MSSQELSLKRFPELVHHNERRELATDNARALTEVAQVWAAEEAQLVEQLARHAERNGCSFTITYKLTIED